MEPATYRQGVPFIPGPQGVRWNRLDRVSRGLALITAGLFAQRVLADGALAPTAATVFGAAQPTGLLDSWLGVIAFLGQCFCSAAACCAIAGGLGHFLGGAAPLVRWAQCVEALIHDERWRRQLRGLVLVPTAELALITVGAPARAAVWQMLRGLLGANRYAVPLLPTILVAETLVAVAAIAGVCAFLRRLRRLGPRHLVPPCALGGVWGLMLFALISTRR